MTTQYFVPHYLPQVGIGSDSNHLEQLNAGEFDLSVVDKKYSPIESVVRISAKPEHDGTLDDKSVAVFIAADPKKVTRLWTMKMGGRVRLEKETGGVWKEVGEQAIAADKVGLINNFLHAMFCRIEITLGDSVRIADSGTRPYVYKSFFEQLLNYSATYQKSILKHDGYVPDNPVYATKTNETVADSDALSAALEVDPTITTGRAYNQAWGMRRKDFSKGQWYEFYMPIYHDLLKAKKCLPPGVEMKINFYFNTDQYPIWMGSSSTTGTTTDPPKYRLAFEKDSFYVDYERFVVKKEITRAYQRTLAAGRYLAIPVIRTIVRSYRVTKSMGPSIGRESWIPRASHLPSQVIVCFVKGEAYDGSTTDNPYYLQHLDLTNASLVVNSEAEPSQGYYTVKYGDKNPRGKAFFWKMMREIGHVTGTQFETGLTMEGFFSSQFFLCFDRSPCKDNSFEGALYDSGSLSLKLELKGELPVNNMQVIALMSYSSNVCIYNDTVKIEFFD